MSTSPDVKPLVAKVFERAPWVREEARQKGKSVRVWQYKPSVCLQVMSGTSKLKGGDRPFIEVGLAFDDAHGGTNAESLAEFREQLGPRGSELGLKARTEQAGAKCFLSRRFEVVDGDADAAYDAGADLAVSLLELGLGSSALREYYRGLRERHAAPAKRAEPKKERSQA